MDVLPQTCRRWWGESARGGRQWCKNQELAPPFNDHSFRFMWVVPFSAGTKNDLCRGNYWNRHLSTAAWPHVTCEASSLEARWWEKSRKSNWCMRTMSKWAFCDAGVQPPYTETWFVPGFPQNKHASWKKGSATLSNLISYFISNLIWTCISADLYLLWCLTVLF